MLLSFKVRNFRSFREEAVLDMEAASLSEYRECLIPVGNAKFLPVAAIYGKNGGGKSNLIRALWLGVNFVRNAQLTQHDKASVPVRPFELDDYSSQEPTVFEYNYIHDGVKYQYGFAATKACIVKEYLYHSPKGKRAKVFDRNFQEFSFPDSTRKINELIAEAVAPNQLFVAVARTMNSQPVVQAMEWFREGLHFSRDYSDIRKYIEEYQEDQDMLKAIKRAAQTADIGVEDIQFRIDSRDITDLVPDNVADEVRAKIANALRELKDALESDANDAEAKLKVSEISATTLHFGVGRDGEVRLYPLQLRDESDGTRRLMALSPAIERTLGNGGVFVVDELEREMHPLLMEHIIKRYQDRESNPHGAQLIFTSHNVELLSMTILRRDQIFFVDKDRQSGASELYSLIDFSPRKDENLYRGYLLGKFGAVPRLED